MMNAASFQPNLSYSLRDVYPPLPGYSYDGDEVTFGEAKWFEIEDIQETVSLIDKGSVRLPFDRVLFHFPNLCVIEMYHRIKDPEERETPEDRFDDDEVIYEITVPKIRVPKKLPAEWKEWILSSFHGHLIASYFTGTFGSDKGIISSSHYGTVPLDPDDEGPYLNELWEDEKVEECLIAAINTIVMINARVLKYKEPREKTNETPQGKPGVRETIISLEPVKALESKSLGEIISEGVKALHDVRGHWATYTEEAPMFGKYVGRFWVPAHVRGDARNGVVKSSYKVSI